MVDKKQSSQKPIDRRKQALRDNLRRRKTQLRDVSGKQNSEIDENRPTSRVRSLDIAIKDDH